MKELSIFTDGASRGNPGISSYGYVITSKEDLLIFEEGKYIGIATNNIAEYTAVLEALKKVLELSKDHGLEVKLYADSKLVVEQLSGRFKIKSPHLKEFITKIKQLEKNFGKISYHHIPRAQNYKADKLANMALDTLL